MTTTGSKNFASTRVKIVFCTIICLAILGGWFSTPSLVRLAVGLIDDKTETGLASQGQFGDQFGAFSALVSSLSLAGVVLAFFLQDHHHKLETNRLREERVESEKSAKLEALDRDRKSQLMQDQLNHARLEKAVQALPFWEVRIIEGSLPKIWMGDEQPPAPFVGNVCNLGAPVYAVQLAAKKLPFNITKSSRMNTGATIDLLFQYEEWQTSDFLTISYVTNIGVRKVEEFAFGNEMPFEFLEGAPKTTIFEALVESEKRRIFNL